MSDKGHGANFELIIECPGKTHTLRFPGSKTVQEVRIQLRL